VRKKKVLTGFDSPKEVGRRKARNVDGRKKKRKKHLNTFKAFRKKALRGKQQICIPEDGRCRPKTGRLFKKKRDQCKGGPRRRENWRAAPEMVHQSGRRSGRGLEWETVEKGGQAIQQFADVASLSTGRRRGLQQGLLRGKSLKKRFQAAPTAGEKGVRQVKVAPETEKNKERKIR